MWSERVRPDGAGRTDFVVEIARGLTLVVMHIPQYFPARLRGIALEHFSVKNPAAMRRSANGWSDWANKCAAVADRLETAADKALSS